MKRVDTRSDARFRPDDRLSNLVKEGGRQQSYGPRNRGNPRLSNYVLEGGNPRWSLRCWLFGHQVTMQMGFRERWCDRCGKVVAVGAPW